MSNGILRLALAALLAASPLLAEPARADHDANRWVGATSSTTSERWSRPPSNGSGGTIQSGDRTYTASIRGTDLRIYTYRPNRCTPKALAFIHHGSGRTAESYRNGAKRLADRHCLVVIAPLFDRERFPSWKYQRGGLVNGSRTQPYGSWTVHYVEPLVAWARGKMNDATMPYYLYGHSAGGQFLSRVAAFATPDDAERIIIANPSTHVWPSLDEDIPYGFGNLPGNLSAKAMLRDYLTAPITIYLGSEDNDTSDDDLAKGRAAMRQGAHRLERGLNAFKAAEKAAKDNGWPFGWKLVIAKGVGHTNGGMLRAPEANEAFGLK